MQRMVIHKIECESEIAEHYPKRRRMNPESHLDRFGGASRVNAAADAAGTAGYKDRIARIAPLQDHFITTKERGNRIGFKKLSLLQICHRMKRERSRDPRY